jgi:hypothetical protein
MADDAATTNEQETPGASGRSQVRARMILRIPKVWIFPLAIPAVMIALSSRSSTSAR